MGDTLEALREMVKLRNELPRPEECREIRRRCRVSAADLAGVLAVSEAAVTAWERGTRSPHGPNREKYARALRVLLGTGPQSGSNL
jgi:DNA-binding transcriptional regulator YiaG